MYFLCNDCDVRSNVIKGMIFLKIIADSNAMTMRIIIKIYVLQYDKLNCGMSNKYLSGAGVPLAYDIEKAVFIFLHLDWCFDKSLMKIHIKEHENYKNYTKPLEIRHVY
ncbi:hypothetical protein [Caldicoprobacter algeriensis]|uniref:hypothetical protein n=1 Tax=Caldicoprobacter algeriensis TaxID=699281 RepID=UPI0020799143|nr:hypothetical protein [Caldicoprobacter algeriensis]